MNWNVFIQMVEEGSEVSEIIERLNQKTEATPQERTPRSSKEARAERDRLVYFLVSATPNDLQCGVVRAERGRYASASVLRSRVQRLTRLLGG